MDNDERFEQEAQASYKSTMENLADVLEPEYTCNECGEVFTSTEHPDYVECPECFSDDVSTETEETREDYEESVLSFDKQITYNVTLYTGGPAGGFLLYCDSDGYILNADFWHQDWFKAKRKFALIGDELDNVRQMFGAWVEMDNER